MAVALVKRVESCTCEENRGKGIVAYTCDRQQVSNRHQFFPYKLNSPSRVDTRYTSTSGHWHTDSDANAETRHLKRSEFENAKTNRCYIYSVIFGPAAVATAAAGMPRVFLSVSQMRTVHFEWANE